MIDIHCHILPYVDDGVRTMDEALDLIRMEVLGGTKTFFATPHVIDKRDYDRLERITEGIVAAAAHADTLYNNSVGLSGGFSSSLRNYFADDFSLSAANPGVQVTGINFGYATQANNASFDVLITFYQNLSTSSTDTTTSVLSNPVYTQRFSFVNVTTANAYYTGELTLPGGGFFLPPIGNTSNQTHGIEVRFVTPGTNTLTSVATGLFQGNSAPRPAAASTPISGTPMATGSSMVVIV